MARMNEMAVLDWIQSMFWSPTMDTVMATLGLKAAGVMILAAVLVPLLIIRRYRRLAMVILMAIIILYAVSELLVKPMIARPRPFVEDPGIVLLLEPPGGFSFFSTHTMISFLGATVVFIRASWKLGAVFYILALLISFSRMYLYFHYLSDVITGAVIGMLCAVVICYMLGRYDMGMEERYIRQ
ncbi:MAG: phosphatase PAP2 family protein [Candidatus Methanomethylophilaceae archaeon]